MAKNTIPKDPMAKIQGVAVALTLLVTVIVLIKSLVSTIGINSTDGELMTDGNKENVQAVAEHMVSGIKIQLAPIGHVKTGKKGAGNTSGVRSGEDVYAAVCTVCHASGVAEAPIKGDKAQWEARLPLGLDALIASVTNGKGAMPPKGGNSSLTDVEIRNAVLYLTKAVGADFGKESDGADVKKKVTP